MGIPLAIGDRLGLLTILEKADRSHWICQCDCGVVTTLSTTQLRGSRKSCGCQAKIKKDMLGVRKGRLVVIAPATAKNGVRFWVCRCDCGNETIVSTQELGPSSCRASCGCIRKEMSQNAKKWKPDPRAAAQKLATEQRRERREREKNLEKEEGSAPRADSGVLDATGKS